VGAKRRSIRDVAELAGVSVGTVSNVMNRPDLVSPGTRARVDAAITELGFVRNGAARALRAGESRVVGAIVLDIGNPFFTDIARGIEDRLAEDDRVLMLCSSDGDADRTARHLGLLREQDLHGLLVTPTGDLSVLRSVADAGTPVVLLDRHAGDRAFCSVAVDDVRGGQLVAEHLLAQGHRRIGFVNGPTTTKACADRRRGIRAGLRHAGLDPDRALAEITIGTLNAESGGVAAAELLDRDSGITAIACVNDLVALGVLRLLLHRRLAVPAQMAVIGYDDVEFAAMLATPLSSIAQPRYQIGYAAADLLLAEAVELHRQSPRAAAGLPARPGHAHRQNRYQPTLVPRASSMSGR
jgi:LacI family transcriptional regulator